MGTQLTTTAVGTGVLTPISNEGLIARLGNAARYVIAGVTPTTWFGPMDPISPMAPGEVKGRQWDYPSGYNLNYNVRSGKAVGFDDLRNLAHNCDVLRAVIESRKDQMSAVPWTIRPKTDPITRKPVPGPNQPERCSAIAAFFKKPDGQTRYNAWSRAILEEMFVTDAVALYRHRYRDASLYQLQLIDGATIKPLLAADGRIPMGEGEPAYQQILHGIPAADFTLNELLYAPRNVTVADPYGYSPVEQIIITVNTAIRRALYQLDYYRTGSLPDAVVGLPKEMTTDQIKDFQVYFDSMLSGDGGERRKLRAVPGEFKFQELKAPVLKDDYDEWLARIICYTFNVAPEPFVKMTNRAVGETQKERSEEEGIVPTQCWYADAIMNPIIEEDFSSPDLEFAFIAEDDVDPKVQMEVSTGYVEKGILSIDEVRENIGRSPNGGASGTAMVLTATGFVQIDPEERQAAALAIAEASKPAPGEEKLDENGDPIKELKAGEKKDGGADPKDEKKAGAGAEKLSKGRIVVLRTPDQPTVAMRKYERLIARKASRVLRLLAPSAAAQVRDLLNEVNKADIPKDIVEQLDLSALTLLGADLIPDLTKTNAEAGRAALAKMGVEVNRDLVEQINEDAASWARARAAELVGKKITPKGEIIENPSAKYRIDQTTRDMLRTVISDGLADGLGTNEIADEIEGSGAFSPERAQLIAHTEVANANSAGALDGLKKGEALGLTIKKVWLVDGDPCQVCLDNEADGPIDLDEPFSSGDDAPLAHPKCECALGSVVEDEEDQ